MKKGIKICLVLAGSLLALGLALNLAGAAMGGRRESNQYFEARWEEISHDTGWDSLLVGSDGVHIGGTNGIHVDSAGVNIGGEHGIHVGHHGGSSYSGEKQLVESGELTGITAIEVDVDCGDIWLQEGDTCGVSLDWNLSNYTMSYQVENGVLKVGDESWEGIKWGDNFNIESKVILTVPAGTAVDTLDLSTEFGDIEVDAAITARSAELSTSMGDINCRSLRAGELDAESDMGDVILHLPGGQEEYNWDLETNMGALTVDGQKQSSGMGEISALGGYGPNNVKAQADMGDIQVHFFQ